MNQKTANARIIKGLTARLEMDASLGMDYVSVMCDVDAALRAAENAAEAPLFRANPPPAPKSPASEKKAEPPAAPPPVQRPVAPRTPVEPPSRQALRPAVPQGFSLVPFVEAPPSPEKEALLAELRSECMDCRNCELCERRNSVVWGEGSLDARVMFIGEGPGRDEDAEGRPFVGRSGRLLTDIIEKGMKVPRNGVYIANVVKCRPPGNRDPKPEEVAACSRYLTRQIEVIAPRVLVAVGNVAGRTLLGLEPGASGMRGRWWEYRGIPMRVIYHPSYLLRQRRDEGHRTREDRVTWEDILEVMKKMV